MKSGEQLNLSTSVLTRAVLKHCVYEHGGGRWGNKVSVGITQPGHSCRVSA